MQAHQDETGESVFSNDLNSICSQKYSHKQKVTSVHTIDPFVWSQRC